MKMKMIHKLLYLGLWMSFWGFSSPLFAQDDLIQEFTLVSSDTPLRLCVAVLTEEDELNTAFKDGLKSISEKRAAQKSSKKIVISLQYGEAGLMNCLSPLSGSPQFDRVFILARSLLVRPTQSEDRSALVYFKKLRDLKGKIVSYPYVVEEDLLQRIKDLTLNQQIFIATCYPDALTRNYRNLFGLGVAQPESVFLSQPDVAEVSENTKIETLQTGKQLLRLTSVESALKLFARFLDFR